jgi:hypothetical protein
MTGERIPYERVGQFGFTKDERRLTAVRQWVADAVADGWTIEPTYGSEPVERAARLAREGWVILALMRDNRDRSQGAGFEASINVWGPDGLSIEAPPFYDFATLKTGLTTCALCKAIEVETQRYSFAGRCCAACRPAAAAKYEQGNWTA